MLPSINFHLFLDHLISLVFSCFLAEGWQALFDFLGQSVSSPNSKLRSSALLILGALAQTSSPCLEPHSAMLLQMFTVTLADPEMPVRVLAAFAAMSFMSAVPEDAQRKPFGVLMPLFLQVRFPCTHLLNSLYFPM